MSTRATIAVRRTDRTYAAVYLHYDGYPEHTGKFLMQSYPTQSAAEELVRAGDIRCLNRETGEAERFSDGDPPAKMPTNDSLIDFARNCGARFVYVFDDGAWSCKAL